VRATAAHAAIALQSAAGYRPRQDEEQHIATDFDERAATWDEDPGKVERAALVAAAVRAAVSLDAGNRLLEYGAGTGLASQALANSVGPITLTDPSEGMRTVMAAKVAEGKFADGTRVWDLDLVTDPVPDEAFDLILTVMALHHVTDLAPVLRGFATLLADSGHLCIVDLEADADGSFHRHDSDFDGHHGFSRADLGARLEAEGLTDISFTHCLDINKDDAIYPLFLATATRPSLS
jgi:predicted TPR repeat methyltransferase